MRHAAAGRSTGRRRWGRFAALFVPAVLAVVSIGAGVATGAVPVALAMQGRQTLAFTAEQFEAEASGVLPSFVQNADGSRQPVVVLQLSNVRIQGACISTAVTTPLGTYVLHAATPSGSAPIQVGNAQIAIESLDGVGAAGQEILLGHGTTAPDGTPVDTSTGGVPIRAGNIALDISATARWATVDQLTLSGLTLQVGQDQKRCL